MGRGRSKAKQTKIARTLKYADPGTDLARLQAELAAAGTTGKPEQGPDEDRDERGE